MCHIVGVNTVVGCLSIPIEIFPAMTTSVVPDREIFVLVFCLLETLTNQSTDIEYLVSRCV